MSQDTQTIVLQVVDHVDRKLKEHELQEAKRYDDLAEEMREGQDASARRHGALLQSIQSYMDKIDAKMHEVPCPHLKETIVDANFKGHHDYHRDEMNWNQKITDFKWFVVKAVVGTGSVAFLGWIGILMWSGLLRGPAS